MAERPTHEHVPTDKNLADISNNIGIEWEYLAASLNVHHIAVGHIKVDHKQSTSQQIYNMLLKWRNNEGCNATLASLFDKMHNATGVSIDWNRLREMFGPLVDNVLHTGRDHFKQACPLVSNDIAQIGYIPAPRTSVPQVLLTDENLSAEEQTILKGALKKRKSESRDNEDTLISSTASEQAKKIKTEIPARFSKLLTPQVIMETETLTIECQFTLPNIQVNWQKDGTLISPDKRILIINDHYSHKIVIAGITVKDDGTYTCKYGTEITECKITVEEMQATFSRFLISQTVKETETVTMECHLNKPHVQVIWQKDGSPMLSNNRVLVLDDHCSHKVVIAGVTMTDGGMYTCKCGDEVTECNITVEEIPVKFSKLLIPQKVKETETLTIECQLTKPKAQVLWLKDGSHISNNKVLCINDYCSQKVVIADVTVKDAGTYTCKCGDEITECQISVEEIPAKFTKTLADEYFNEKDTLTLECELTKPNVQVCWQKDGQDIILDNRVQISSNNRLHKLEIADVTMDDSGTYTCVCVEEKTECHITVEANNIPSELLNHPHYMKLYQDALENGKEHERTVRIMIVGCQYQGKTSLARQLLGQSLHDINSTNGVDVNESMCYVRDGKWQILTADKADEYNSQRLAHVVEMIKSQPKSSSECVVELGDTYSLQKQSVYLSHTYQSVVELNSNPGSLQTSEMPAIDKVQPEVELKSYPGSIQTTTTRDKEQEMEEAISKVPNSLNANSVTIDSSKYKYDFDTTNIEIFTSVAKFYSGKIESEINYHISLWDFGGQFVYYSTHQLFHSKEAVYLLVFDLSKSLDEKIKDEIGREKSLRDYLEFWVCSIHCFVGKKTGSTNERETRWSPCILLIGTHKNDPKSIAYGVKKYFREVREIFIKTDLRYHIYGTDFAVDNYKNPDEKDYECLRKSIEDIAGKKLERAFPIPAKWIALEIALLKWKNREIVSFEEVVQISNGLQLLLPNEEIKAFLTYCHEKGRLFYSDKIPKIVLNPQYLIDAFKTIITSKENRLYDVHLQDFWTKLEEKAILDWKFIEHLWQDRFQDNMSIILDFLEAYHIICRIDMDHTRSYLIPSFLKPHNQAIWYEYMLGKCTTPISLVFVFEYSTIIPTIFQRTTAAILRRWQPCKPKEHFLLFENHIAFMLNEWHVGIMKMQQNYIELLIVVLLPENGTSVGELGDQFRRHVMKCIMMEFKNINIIQSAANVKYPFALQFRCMHKEHNGGSINIKHVEKVWDIKTHHCVCKDRMPCLDQSSSHCIELSSVFSDWFQPKPDPKQLQQIYVTDDDLDCIATTICKNFDERSANELSKHLYVTSVEGAHYGKANLAVYDVLLTWIQKEPTKSTFDVLVQALYECNNVDMDFDEMRNFYDDKEMPASFSKHLTPQVIRETGTLTMECQFTLQNVQVNWQKDGTLISPDNRILIISDHYTHKIVIAGVTVKDGGTYTCKYGTEITECKITVEDNESRSQKSILAQTKETVKLGSNDVQQKTNSSNAAKSDDKLCKCTILVMNTYGPRDDKEQIHDRRKNVIRNVVRIAVPSIMLFQEFPWVKLDKSWQADETLCRYRYMGNKQASIIYNENIFAMEDLSQNIIDGILSSLKVVMNTNLRKVIPLDFLPVPRMCISKVKSLSALVMDFLCISWCGPYNKSVNQKIEYFEYFMEFLRCLNMDIKLPILVGGDFNIERDIIKSKVAKPFVLRPYTASTHQKPYVIDFFITTEDLLLDRIGWMDLKEMKDIISPKNIFDRDPIVGHLWMDLKEMMDNISPENIFDHDPIVGHLSCCIVTQPHTNICSTCGRWWKPSERCTDDQTNAHFTSYENSTCSLCWNTNMANRQADYQIKSEFGSPGNFYWNEFWMPEREKQNRIDIQFTKVKKFVNDQSKALIMADGGFKGGNMKYSEDQSAILSWWSAYVDQDEFKRMQKIVNDKHEINEFFDPTEPSIFGNNLFIYDLDQLIEEYERAINGHSEMRRFGSVLYKREVMHAIVIAPVGHEKFADHDLVNLEEANCTLTRNNENKYVWQCFSAIHWDNTHLGTGKKRNWAQLAFAFLLEPENTILKVRPDRLVEIQLDKTIYSSKYPYVL